MSDIDIEAVEILGHEVTLGEAAAIARIKRGVNRGIEDAIYLIGRRTGLTEEDAETLTYAEAKRLFVRLEPALAVSSLIEIGDELAKLEDEPKT